MNRNNWKELVNPHILRLKPYSSARDEFSGDAKVFLDANENPFNQERENWNRYPDPFQSDLKQKLAKIKNIESSQLFLGNGSDEAIDLLFRIFCDPTKDEIITCPPTYGMYSVSAALHNVKNIEVPLTEEYQLDVAGILEKSTANSKLLFICSPNNPTGNSFNPSDINSLLETFPGVVVIDEAYIDFSQHSSWKKELPKFENLVVLQTLSKAWGLAAARLGMAIANSDLIKLFNKVKPPYNISGPSQEVISKALDHEEITKAQIQKILAEREKLTIALKDLPGIKKVYPSDANFLLVKLNKARQMYEELINKKIVVRDRSNVLLCDDSLRITVGTAAENEKLLDNIRTLTTQFS